MFFFLGVFLCIFVYNKELKIKKKVHDKQTASQSDKQSYGVPFVSRWEYGTLNLSILFFLAVSQRNGPHERLRPIRRSQQQHVRLVPRVFPPAPQATRAVSDQLRLPPEGLGPSVREVSKLSLRATSFDELWTKRLRHSSEVNYVEVSLITCIIYFVENTCADVTLTDPVICENLCFIWWLQTHFCK